MPASYIDKYAKEETIINNTLTFFKGVFGTHFHGGGVLVYNSNFSKHEYCLSPLHAAKVASRFIKSSGGAYYSLNTFKKKSAGRAMRVKENLWGLSTIAVDIDKIDKNCICSARNEFIAFLKMNGIPAPTIVVESGSGGYHAYWTFEHLPETMRDSVQAVKLAIVCKLVQLEKEWDFHNLKVDTVALDVSRVLRVPGSTHEDTGMKANYELLRKAYKFSDLKKKVIDFPYNYDYLKQNVANIINWCRNKSSCVKKPKKLFGSPEALAEYRLSELNRLANAGFKFCNCREKACFILRNNAIVLGWSEEQTMNALKDLNQRFYEPLKESELRINSKTRKHYYMKNETIRQMLDLDDGLDYFSTYHRKTKGKKEACKAIIAKIEELAKQYFSISQIAKLLNLSISLVKRRRAELSRTNNEYRNLGVLKQVGAI